MSLGSVPKAYIKMSGTVVHSCNSNPEEGKEIKGDRTIPGDW